MRVIWSGNKCLLCLKAKPLTEEHIVPEALGGKLTCEFLCKSCNSACGASFEAKARTDPSIRIAIERLRPQIPRLADELTENQGYLAVGAGPKSRGYVREGEFRVKGQRLADGSLIQPLAQARKSIETILMRQGLPAIHIEGCLRKFDEAPENCRVALSPSLEVVNWTTESISLDLSNSNLLSPLVALKIAFEFLACHLGTAIYDEATQFNALRRALLCEIEEDPYFKVERLNASEYKSFHGICFEGNEPHARVLIRLFGWLAFRVHFLNLAVGGPRFIYTHYLDSGEENIRMLT